MWPKITLISFGLFLIFGIFLIYPDQKNSPQNEVPPTLNIDAPAIQGFIKTKLGLYKFDEIDVQSFVSKKQQFLSQNSSVVKIKKNVDYYFTNKNISVQQIIDGIDPQAKSVLIAFYSPGENGLSKGYYVFPEGPFANQTKTITDPQNFMIPAGRGFVIISEAESTAFGFLNKNQTNSFQPTLAENIQGWVLLALNSADLSGISSQYSNKIKSIWVQDNQAYKVPSSSFNSFKLSGSYLIWLKLGTPESGQLNGGQDSGQNFGNQNGNQNGSNQPANNSAQNGNQGSGQIGDQNSGQNNGQNSGQNTGQDSNSSVKIGVENLQAKIVGKNIELSWNPPNSTQNQNQNYYYLVEYKLSTANEYQLLKIVNQKSINLENFIPGKTYNFKVTTISFNGTMYETVFTSIST